MIVEKLYCELCAKVLEKGDFGIGDDTPENKIHFYHKACARIAQPKITAEYPELFK